MNVAYNMSWFLIVRTRNKNSKFHYEPDISIEYQYQFVSNKILRKKLLFSRKNRVVLDFFRLFVIIHEDYLLFLHLFVNTSISTNFENFHTEKNLLFMQKTGIVEHLSDNLFIKIVNLISSKIYWSTSFIDFKQYFAVEYNFWNFRIVCW